jgi:alpha-glucuronidase
VHHLDGIYYLPCASGYLHNITGIAVYAVDISKMRFLVTFGLLGYAVAEDGLNGWLRYAPLAEAVASIQRASTPSSIVLLNSTARGPLNTAGDELKKGLQGILTKAAEISKGPISTCEGDSIIIGTAEAYRAACGSAPGAVATLKEDGFWISTKNATKVQIIGQNERGALYGAFEYLSMLGQGNFSLVEYATSPSVPIRWANQWDNLDASGSHGSVERGYAGPSIFFRNGGVVSDMTRIAQYGRLLASIRINGIIVNNVNANANLLNDRNLDGLGKIAEALRPYGVKVGISLNFASPQSLGGLSTFDPLDNGVINWWKQKTDQIYKRIPDFAGYLVKANSEGQPGPLTYRRTLADGANMFAKAVKAYGGVIMFRAFVYDQLSYSDKKADRANAAVEFFKPLDGKFDENVVVQIKYGPIDFQVREPASPLFANLPNTNAAIELQITQEYLGQQCHLVYMAPMWKEILDFDLRMGGQPSRVRDILEGWRPSGRRQLGGYAGVTNVGTDDTWLGSHLAMSNLYAFGRLAWNPADLSEGGYYVSIPSPRSDTYIEDGWLTHNNEQ